MPWSLNQRLSRDWSSRHHGQHHHPTWGQEQGTSTPSPENTQQCSEKRLSCPLPVAGIKSAQLLPPVQTYLNPGGFTVPLLLRRHTCHHETGTPELGITNSAVKHLTSCLPSPAHSIIPNRASKDRLQSQHSLHMPSSCAPSLHPRPPTLRPSSFHSLPRLVCPLSCCPRKDSPEYVAQSNTGLGIQPPNLFHTLFCF